MPVAKKLNNLSKTPTRSYYKLQLCLRRRTVVQRGLDLRHVFIQVSDAKGVERRGAYSYDALGDVEKVPGQETQNKTKKVVLAQAGNGIAFL